MKRHRSFRAGCCVAVHICVLNLAQSPSAEAQVTLDGSMGPQQALPGPNFAIDSARGQIRGGNLFHSFGRFNVRQGESATFTNSLPNVITNILGRVTGGERSVIDGLVRSQIAGANLFLFNPSGLAFGPNASLDVSGAFHVSTADYLRLADGGIFHASPEKASNLTIAPPAAFGFLSPAPAPITFDQTLLQAAQGQTLSVIGGDVQLDGTVLRASGGLIQIVSAASPGEVVPRTENSVPQVHMQAFARLGKVEILNDSNATTSGPAGAGTVLIRSGRLVLESSSLNSNTTGAGMGASLGADVRVTGDVVLNGGQILVFSFDGGTAGDVRIAAGGRLQVTSGGFINVENAGNLTIDTPMVEVSQGGSIGAQTNGMRPGGTLRITTDNLLISTGDSPFFTGIFTAQFIGSGTARVGDLIVNAKDVTIAGSSGQGGLTGIFGQNFGLGSGGFVLVDAKSLHISGAAEISNTTFGPGPGGGLLINIDGPISITGTQQPNRFTGLFSNALDSGPGGHIDVTSKSLVLTKGSSIQGLTLSSGDAGGATIKTGSLDISNGSGIFTNALFGFGNAGDLTVNADTIVIRGIRESIAPYTSLSDFTGLSTTAGFFAKRAGNITVMADSIVVSDKGSISSLTAGSGNAGTIRIIGGDLTVKELSQINASTSGAGRGGNIHIQANSVVVTGAGAPLGPADPSFSGIASQTQGSVGGAGDLTMDVGSLQVLDGARISVQTFGAGKGGNLNIKANNLLVSGINAALAAYQQETGKDMGGGRSTIATSSERSLLGDGATGSAGNLLVLGDDIRVDAGGALTSRTSTPGRGGTLDIQAGRVTLIDALVSAESVTSLMAGRAGDISIRGSERVQIGTSAVTTAADRAQGGAIGIYGNHIQLDPGTLLSARASGAGDAGNIAIVAGDTIVASSTIISTEATQSDGGNITLLAPTMVHLVDTKVTTSVGTGQGKGGNILIDPQFVILDGTEIRADAFGGPGGNISIFADVFLTQNSALSASSVLSTPGTIDIQARITDISGNAARLPEGVAPPSVVLRAACSTRLAGGTVSSLVLAGREGMAPDPEGLLPSPLLAVDPQMPLGLSPPPAYRVTELAKPLLRVSACAAPLVR